MRKERREPSLKKFFEVEKNFFGPGASTSIISRHVHALMKKEENIALFKAPAERFESMDESLLQRISSKALEREIIALKFFQNETLRRERAGMDLRASCRRKDSSGCPSAG